MNTKLFKTSRQIYFSLEYDMNTILLRTNLFCGTQCTTICYNVLHIQYNCNANTMWIQCEHNTLPDGHVLRCKSPSQLPSNKAQLNPFLFLSLFCLIPLPLLCKCIAVVLFHRCFVVFFHCFSLFIVLCFVVDVFCCFFVFFVAIFYCSTANVLPCHPIFQNITDDLHNRGCVPSTLNICKYIYDTQFAQFSQSNYCK